MQNISGERATQFLQFKRTVNSLYVIADAE
jgi:hypothetical protein